MAVTIYHNPKCSTSRNTLELIRESGIEPTVIELSLLRTALRPWLPIAMKDRILFCWTW